MQLKIFVTPIAYVPNAYNEEAQVAMINTKKQDNF